MVSWLSPADVDSLSEVALDGHATKLALAGGGTPIIFARFDPIKSEQNNQYPYNRIPAQTCLVEYGGKMPAVSQGAASSVIESDGTLIRPVPFDVLSGDLFTLGDSPEDYACIVLSVDPPQLGLQKAWFKVRVGEQ